MDPLAQAVHEELKPHDDQIAARLIAVEERIAVQVPRSMNKYAAK